MENKGNELVLSGSLKVAMEAGPDNNTVDEVNNMLLQMMKEVKQNSGAIEQAEAMASVAGRVLDGLKIKSINRAMVAKNMGFEI
jgi:hypothetical protein